MIACTGCGCKTLDPVEGCMVCGYKSTKIYPKLIMLPSPRNVAEREVLFRRIVQYAVDSRDVEGATHALMTQGVMEGSAIAKAMGVET
jgi:hypothetical protein